MSAQSAIYNPTNTTSAASGDGFSTPRLTTTGRLAISFGTTDKGMMVYDTTLNNLFIWNGSAWESVPASGDAGANGSVQYNDNGVVSGAVNFVWDKTNNRVGVVTATPRVSLDVASGDIYSSGQITWGGSSPTANQGFLSFTGGNAVIGSTGATALLSYTNGVERYNIGSTGIATWSNVGGVAGTAMTLNSTGLGVGTTNYIGKIQAAGLVAAADPTFGTSGTFIGAILNNDNTAPGIDLRRWTGAAANHGTTYISTDYTGNTYFYNGQQASNTKATALRLLINTNGVLVFNGGNASSNGVGINFPATQVASSDANTLDDYEEGTWTIVVNNQLGNSATIASQIARYVKIGIRVFVFGDFTLSAKGAAAAGDLVYLGNLPFVPNSTLFEGSVVHKYDNVNLTTNGQINIISAAGGNNVCFFPISSATTGTSNLTFGQITDTTRLVFNFSYDV